MDHAHLHADIWDMVFLFLSESTKTVTIWKVMCTCRMLRGIGMRHYLERFQDNGCGFQDALRFLAFVLTDASARCPLVREFHIVEDPFAFDTRTLYPFLQFFEHARNLRAVSLPVCILDAEPRIEKALTHVCRGLTSVNFRAEDHEHVEPLNQLFARAQWSLVHVHLEVTELFMQTQLKMLESFRETLERVELLTDALDDDYRPAPFMRVWRLAVDWNFGADHRSLLAEIFPNVRTLVATESMHAEDRIADRRARNAGPGTSWKHLQRVTGNLNAVYALAIKGRIPSMRLEVPTSSSESLHFLQTLLREHQPRVLDLDFVQGQLHYLNRFNESLPDSTSYLEALSIGLSEYAWSTKDVTYDWVTNLPDVLSALSIRQLRIDVTSFGARVPGNKRIIAMWAHTRYVEEWLLRAAIAVVSLRDVSAFSVQGEYQRRWYYKVIRQDGAPPVLEERDRDEGRQLDEIFSDFE